MSSECNNDVLTCSILNIDSIMASCSNSCMSDTDTVYSEDYNDMASSDAKENVDTEMELERRLATLTASSGSVDEGDESLYASEDRCSISTLEFDNAGGSDTGRRYVTEAEKIACSEERDVRLNLLLRRHDDDSQRTHIVQENRIVTRPAIAPRDLLLDREDREFDFLKAEPVRRTTSLKTGATPPDTPRRKKEVRFADALGLDLESVRHIMNTDQPPLVPSSATKDLNLARRPSDLDDYESSSISSPQVRHLCACFSQPGCSPDFHLRVRERKVSLESFQTADDALTVSGIVRVSNIAFQKNVVIRHTVNGWMTFSDVQATYVEGSSDGSTDRFHFVVQLPEYFGVGCLMEFSIMYVSADQVFWDSNFGSNYRVECYVATSNALPKISSEDHAFY